MFGDGNKLEGTPHEVGVILGHEFDPGNRSVGLCTLGRGNKRDQPVLVEVPACPECLKTEGLCTILSFTSTTTIGSRVMASAPTVPSSAALFFFFFFFRNCIYCLKCSYFTLIDRRYVSYKRSTIQYVGWPGQGHVYFFFRIGLTCRPKQGTHMC